MKIKNVLKLDQSKDPVIKQPGFQWKVSKAGFLDSGEAQKTNP